MDSFSQTLKNMGLILNRRAYLFCLLPKEAGLCCLIFRIGTMWTKKQKGWGCLGCSVHHVASFSKAERLLHLRTGMLTSFTSATTWDQQHWGAHGLGQGEVVGAVPLEAGPQFLTTPFASLLLPSGEGPTGVSTAGTVLTTVLLVLKSKNCTWLFEFERTW